MLFTHTQFKRLLTVFGQRKQIKIVAGSAVQDAPVEVHGGIDQGVGCSAVFRLHVKGEIADSEIAVVPENHRLHSLPLATLRLTETCRPAGVPGKFPGTFDRWRLTRYYNSLTMSPSG